MTDDAAVVVVGGSLAGATTVDALLSAGHQGPITLLGDEAERAYARPPLSKEILAGSVADESVVLPATEAPNLTVRTGTRAVGLDPRARAVRLASGESVPFDKLVIATGTSARRLGPTPDQFVLRTLDDAVALRTAMASARSMVVIGGGFLGMEIASSGQAQGLSVTVLDIRPPLVSVLGEYLAGLIVDAAVERGVRIVTCAGGVSLRHDGARIAGAATPDGTHYPADLVVTAVGDVPNTGWLTGSGVSLTDAGWVAVDSRCRATVSGLELGTVLAVGDVAATVTDSGLVRMPHWENAIGQARAAARTLLDGDAAPEYRAEPFFWTSAFGMAIKAAGPLPVTGAPQVTAGDVAQRSALLRWDGTDGPTVVTVNHRIPVGKLKRMATV